MPLDPPANTLYYGDNLDIMRRYLPDESVDLIYLDPPFKSNQNYNVLFKEQDGSRAASQIRAFEDTWTWNQEDEAVYADLVTAGGRVADALEAFRKLIGECDMLAYLVMMAPRLQEMRRVLRLTGSIYLHCDPTASHYLKLLMDAVFGGENFRNEIIWCYFIGGRISKWHYGRRHDILFFYTKCDEYMFNWESILEPWTEEGAAKFKYSDESGKYRLMGRFIKGSPIKGHRDISPEWEKTHPELVYRHYMKEGKMAVDYWNIPPINQASRERLGYPTQKPEALLERIIKASSNEGDVVLDPFCGCGTTVAVAERLKRCWIGIDITHLAITLIKQRLMDTFGEQAAYQVIGEPVSVPDAAALAASDPYQFQWWALGLVGARPVEGKKGADKGIDGRIIFQGDVAGKFEAVILSVKAGHVTVSQVRDLCHVVDREKASIGVFISMQESTEPMRMEAVTTGFYESTTWGQKYPKVQLLTVAELLAGKHIYMPPIKQVGATFKKAPKASSPKAENMKIPFEK